MACKYQSSSETTNFARLSRLVVDVISDLIRAVLKAKASPRGGIQNILKSQKVQLSGNLERLQRRVLYRGRFVSNLKDLDFSLLYRLVRNIQGINIQPHQNGWGATPDPADRSLSANIDRLRVQRNEAYGHLPTASLSDTDLNSRWSLIRQSVEEIEKDALTGDTYVTAVDDLLTMNMDPEAEKCYIEVLEKQHKADLKVKAMIREVKAGHEVMATDISNVSTRQEVMATNISDVTTRQEAMATNISDVTTRQEAMATDIHNLQDDVTAIKDTVDTTSANTGHFKAIHPDLIPMIETTKARIKKEKEESKFYPTKGFRDAKDKLLKNRVVVIKGNTGDGKTVMAVQLLHWVSQERHNGRPLQVHKIKKLDVLAPNLELITFIDDIFGEQDVCMKDVNEWNKRISHVEALFVGEQNQTNFLIITIRNEVFNSLEKRSLGRILSKVNIVDLSSHTYKIAGEKKELLDLYKPKNFSWTETEKTQILTYAPNVGFPQCCKLFYNSKELQKERVGFFENPTHFLNEALSKLRESSALLYLFFNDGMISVKDLDPNSKNVNEKLLEEAYDINLMHNEEDSTKLTFKKKVEFVKDNLEKLLGFLVVKEKHKSGDYMYRFNHDSVKVAVALLYGKVTPIGYIQNCPNEFLGFVTISKAAKNRIGISSDHYTEMFERLLRVFKSNRYYFAANIGFLDVWNDPVFVEKFVRWLINDRKIDQLDALKLACSFGAEELVLYLLSAGVKTDKDTYLYRLFVRHGDDRNKQLHLLRKIVVYLDDERKVHLLNELCYLDAEDCASYLLSEGVKPDEGTALSLVKGRWSDNNRQMRFLSRILEFFNNEFKLDVFKAACYLGKEECASYLLSEGVKPYNARALWSLIDRHRCDSDRQVCLLRKVSVYLHDKIKIDVLNEAYYHCAEKCVSYLLSEGVKPDENTVLSLVNGQWKDENRNILLSRTYELLNDESKLALLNKACRFNMEEIALKLLSEGVKPDKDTELLSLVEKKWYDSEEQVYFLKKILIYMNDKEKADVLKKACYRHAEESALYLLSQGVKPNTETYLSFMIDRRWNDRNSKLLLLGKLLAYLDDETNVYLLNDVCSCGLEEDVLYLLSEGVKPNKDTEWVSLFYRHKGDSNKQVCLLKQIVAYLNDETKVVLLNDVCSVGAEECVLYLLSEGVKPWKKTMLSLVFRDRDGSTGQVCLLKKIGAYLNDETKVVLLNYACWFGKLESALYLLSEGVKPNKDTPWMLFSSYWKDRNRQMSLIKNIVVYMDDETKTALMNAACEWKNRDEECVLYLLSEGVKPDNDTDLWLLIGSDRKVCLLRKIVVYLNDLTKVALLNKACYFRAEECALYLLGEGVEPDKETVFCVFYEGKVFCQLLQRDVTPIARDQNNDNVLHFACDGQSDEMVSLSCDAYPHLVHDINKFGQTPLHVVAARLGYCSMFKTVERCVLNSLYRVEDQEHKCETVDGRTVHRQCVCAMYMAQLLDNDGKTVLHRSCMFFNGNWEVCFYICQSYPALTTAVDNDGRHFLHYVARLKVDVKMFIECETHVKQYLESIGRKYDITTILDNNGESVLDIAKKSADFWLTNNKLLLDYLVKEFGK